MNPNDLKQHLGGPLGIRNETTQTYSSSSSKITWAVFNFFAKIFFRFALFVGNGSIFVGCIWSTIVPTLPYLDNFHFTWLKINHYWDRDNILFYHLKWNLPWGLLHVFFRNVFSWSSSIFGVELVLEPRNFHSASIRPVLFYRF